MAIEFRRFTNSKYAVLVSGLVFLCYILGYVMLTTIDKTQVNSIRVLCGSTYTVLTQFGMLVFSPVVISLFSNDYRDRNILFYMASGYNAAKFFLYRVMLAIASFAIGIIAVSTLVATFFGDYSILLPVTICYLLVSTCFIIEISLWAFVFKSFVSAFFTNFAVWLISIVLSAVGGVFRYAAYYDASSPLYREILDLLYGESRVDALMLYLNSALYNSIVFIIALSLIILFRKRWVKNGV